MLIDDLERDLERYIGKMARFIINRAILSLGYNRENIDKTKIGPLLDRLKEQGAVSNEIYRQLYQYYVLDGRATGINKREESEGLPGVVEVTSDVKSSLGQEFIDEKYLPSIGDIVVYNEKKNHMSIKALIYLIKEKDASILCVSRLPAEDFIERHNLKDIFSERKFPIYWLSSVDSEKTIHPVHLGKFLDIVKTFIENNETPAVYIDGIEYLISLNNFLTVLRFIEKLNEVVKIHRAWMIMPINLDALERKEVAFLEREVRVIDMKDE